MAAPNYTFTFRPPSAVDDDLFYRPPHTYRDFPYQPYYDPAGESTEVEKKDDQKKYVYLSVGIVIGVSFIVFLLYLESRKTVRRELLEDDSSASQASSRHRQPASHSSAIDTGPKVFSGLAVSSTSLVDAVVLTGPKYIKGRWLSTVRIFGKNVLDANRVMAENSLLSLLLEIPRPEQLAQFSTLGDMVVLLADDSGKVFAFACGDRFAAKLISTYSSLIIRKGYSTFIISSERDKIAIASRIFKENNQDKVIDETIVVSPILE